MLDYQDFKPLVVKALLYLPSRMGFKRTKMIISTSKERDELLGFFESKIDSLSSKK